MKLLQNVYCRPVNTLSKWGDDWLLGLAARLVFFAVLFFFFWVSATGKVGAGFSGFFQVQDGAYFQIFSDSYFETIGYDVSQVPIHLDLIVYAGTYAEFLLPLLIVLGLFTRIAALGMIVFIIVLSVVDVYTHGISAGALFDNKPESIILDQRLLWGLLFSILVVKGAGKLSLDYLLVRIFFKKELQNTQ